MRRAMTFPGELVGKIVEVIASTNPGDVGLKGKVVDETKSTLKVEHRGRSKTLFKNRITLRLAGQAIEGKALAKRPEDRIKSA